jgi:hypothetical protein
MKPRTWAAGLVCVAAGFVLSGLSQPRLSGEENEVDRSRVKWEYKIENNLDFKGLNKLGDQGWDLVTVTPSIPGGNFSVFYFRRSKL